jgi:hypothetical protein
MNLSKFQRISVEQQTRYVPSPAFVLKVVAPDVYLFRVEVIDFVPKRSVRATVAITQVVFTDVGPLI